MFKTIFNKFENNNILNIVRHTKKFQVYIFIFTIIFYTKINIYISIERNLKLQLNTNIFTSIT